MRKTMSRLTLCLRPISPATRRKTAAVGESVSMNLSKARPMPRVANCHWMNKDTLLHNPMLMIARGVASPRIPETFSFWIISLRLGTAEGEVIEDQAFRRVGRSHVESSARSSGLSRVLPGAARLSPTRASVLPCPFPPPACSTQNW
jgi:hypothetical protein